MQPLKLIAGTQNRTEPKRINPAHYHYAIPALKLLWWPVLISGLASGGIAAPPVARTLLIRIRVAPPCGRLPWAHQPAHSPQGCRLSLASICSSVRSVIRPLRPGLCLLHNQHACSLCLSRVSSWFSSQVATQSKLGLCYTNLSALSEHRSMFLAQLSWSSLQAG
jgi:hypothetical protein